MIPLTEWSRRRPTPVFTAFDDVEDDGAIECDGLVGDLINNIQVASAAEANAALDAKCAEAKQATMVDLVARVQAAATRFSADLMQHFNAVLKPWMGKQIEETAVEAFCAAVAQAVGDELSQEVAVEAPQALQDKLIERFGAESIRTQITDSPDTELHARVGSTNISTEISVWQERLNSVLP